VPRQKQRKSPREEKSTPRVPVQCSDAGPEFSCLPPFLLLNLIFEWALCCQRRLRRRLERIMASSVSASSGPRKPICFQIQRKAPPALRQVLDSTPSSSPLPRYRPEPLVPDLLSSTSTPSSTSKASSTTNPVPTAPSASPFLLAPASSAPSAPAIFPHTAPLLPAAVAAAQAQADQVWYSTSSSSSSPSSSASTTSSADALPLFTDAQCMAFYEACIAPLRAQPLVPAYNPPPLPPPPPPSNTPSHSQQPPKPPSPFPFHTQLQWEQFRAFQACNGVLPPAPAAPTTASASASANASASAGRPLLVLNAVESQWAVTHLNVPLTLHLLQTGFTVNSLVALASL
jgi:hypothetical protein